MKHLLFLGILILVLIPSCLAAMPPEANFDSNITRFGVCIYDPIQFTDTSNFWGGTWFSWWWLFGDSQDSHDQNPVHYYDTPGVYTVQLQIQNDYGEDWENKTAYITVRDCYSADFISNSTCSIGKPKVVFLNETGTMCSFDGDPGKSAWNISPNNWLYWNGTDWVIDTNGIFDGGDSHDNNATINVTEYGIYTVTHTCMFPPPVGITVNTKTDYIIVGVNGTVCDCETCRSSFGCTETGGEPLMIVFGFLGAIIAAPIIIRRRRKRIGDDFS